MYIKCVEDRKLDLNDEIIKELVSISEKYN